MRRKRSLVSRGKYPSEESRRKMGESHRGFHHSEKTKELLRQKNLGVNNPMYGKHITDSQRAVLSQRWSGKNNPKYGKPLDEKTKQILLMYTEARKTSVDVYNMDGVFLKTFPTQLAASKALGINQGTISCQCSRKYRISKNGYIFRYHGEQF